MKQLKVPIRLENNVIHLYTEGDMACFTNPMFKVERFSYEIMTPTAARGILDAIYWHPSFYWQIVSIKRTDKPSWYTFRTNEIGDFDTVSQKNNRDQKSNSVLIGQSKLGKITPLSYVISAYPVITHKLYDEHNKPIDSSDTKAKILSIFGNRATKGKYYKHPCYGLKEFAINKFHLVNSPDDIISHECGEKKIGKIFHSFIDNHYGDKKNGAKPIFFDATIIDGVMKIPDIKQLLF